MSDPLRSSATQSAATPADRAWRGFKLGVVTTGVLIALKFAVEHSPVGHQAEQMMMDLQQLRLAQAFRHDSPVAVVDISDMALTPRDPPMDATPVTDRHALQAIVAAVGAQSPVAIGIDVLLDPPAGHVLTDAERRLLETCLALDRRGVPTLVAIFDGVVRGPAEWLGERRFGDLAAYALVPRPSEFQSTTSMVRTIDITVGEQSYHVNSMAHALALRVNTKALEGRAWTNWVAVRFPWLVARERAVTGDHFTTAEFLIDYGIVGRLERTAIRASTPAEISAAARQLEDKIVLVGRGQIDRTTDVFTVPGRSSPVAGVYVHAAATHTLVSAPLFRLKFWGRVLADLLTAGIALFVVVLVRRRWNLGAHGAHRTAAITSIVMASLVFIAGYLFVSATGIMWTDCLMVSIALLLHVPLEFVVGMFLPFWAGEAH